MYSLNLTHSSGKKAVMLETWEALVTLLVALAVYDIVSKKGKIAESLKSPDLMCKPQCVPAELDRDIFMFPLFPSALNHIYVHTYAPSVHTGQCFPSFRNRLALNVWPSYLVPILSLPLSHSANHSFMPPRGPGELNQSNFSFSWSLYFSFQYANKTSSKNRCSGLF